MVDVRYLLLLSVTLTNGFTNVFTFFSVNAGLVSTWRMMARLAWTSTSVPRLSPAASDASTPMAPTSAYVWMAMKPWNATPMCARLCPVSVMLTITLASKILKRIFSHVTKMFIISAEEPFLIMADHHEIRKLSVDGSNYTILKQVCVISHHIMALVSFSYHQKIFREFIK